MNSRNALPKAQSSGDAVAARCAGCGGEAGPFGCVWNAVRRVLCAVCAWRLCSGEAKSAVMKPFDVDCSTNRGA